MPTPVPPPNSHFISLATFNEMKKLYGDNEENILATQFQGKEILCTSETFNNDDIKTLQSATGCAGVRIYYGMSTDLKVHAMLVAVDKDGNDLLPNQAGTFAKDSSGNFVPPVLLEDSQRCPPSC